MRRLAIAIGALAVAALTPSLSSGALLDIDVLDDEFAPPNAQFNLLDIDNPNVVWDWGGFMGDSTHNHTVTQKKGLFNSGAPKKTGVFELQASAGTYPYYCEVHRASGMEGKVKLVPGVADATADSFRVFWATATTTTGKRFDVRYRVDGGDWVSWKRRTAKLGATFGVDDKPVAVDFTAHDTYEVAARSQKGSPAKRKRSGWSPPVVVTE